MGTSKFASLKGRIHSFESFSALDGPGIRYVIFFCGCPLRCIFCHNIDMVECLPGTYREYSVSEVINKVERARTYFDRSGGGVTLSGGEPFFQPDFMRELLKEFKQRNIHTVVDTNLYTSAQKIKEISKWVDLFLVGLKHIDSNKHKQLTGQSNTLILENIAYLDSLKKPFWLRYVVISGITDNKDDIMRLAKFLHHFNYLEWVELLPYHSMGIQKWKSLNKPYALPHVVPPTKKEMDQVKQIFRALNVPVLPEGDVER
ncbi:MAG: pyruvate formate lyase-activating protein [Euryarchaeota archaeon]|nr:pyruvate formate lyase-activating protein [Euryarchaeota archaeon]MBV1729868.1 pyruvate formate lyase-activating protein [Methanobacterium sp.]MBU4547944.1 pyruvate formate lyase-activating protein [Euryarchaeota archaeon]MBU4608845.1 pyruvate formate lyase-activating protein [Euryarchaeota archaeon]MBV1754797.1 pyruvate formate lyase-activating protein [Methanobacterium sp.]